MFCAAARAGEAGVFFDTESFAHSEPVPVHAYATDWNAPLASGSDAMTRTWIEAGVRSHGWTVSSVQRLDYEIKATRDAAVLYHTVRNHLPLPTGKQFDLDLKAYQQRSRGVRLAYRWQARPDWSVELGVTRLDAMRLTDGRLKGSASAVSSSDYDFTAQLDYFYSRDALLHRTVAAPGGQGWSTDLAMDWRINDALTVSGRVRDLYGYLRWNQAPFTTATASSANKTYDSDGYVIYSPTISGIEGNRDYLQRLHPEGRFNADWQWAPQDSVGLRLRVTEVKTYASLRVQRSWSDSLSFNAELLPAQRALGVGAAWGPLAVSWLADSLRFEDAHVLQLQVSLAHTFNF